MPSRSRAVLALALGLVTGCWSPPEHVEDVRPLRLVVMDAHTGAPLARVPVAHAIETVRMRGRLLGFIPALEPDLGQRLAFGEMGMTDARGEVSFAARALRLAGNERLETELVYVNVGVDLEHPASRRVLDVRAQVRRGDPSWDGGVSDDVYLVWSPLIEREAYRNPLRSHRGVRLEARLGDVQPPGGAAREVWDGGGPFRVQRDLANLRAGGGVVVALDPAPRDAQEPSPAVPEP